MIRSLIKDSLSVPAALPHRAAVRQGKIVAAGASLARHVIGACSRRKA